LFYKYVAATRLRTFALEFLEQSRWVVFILIHEVHEADDGLIRIMEIVLSPVSRALKFKLLTVPSTEVLGY